MQAVDELGMRDGPSNSSDEDHSCEEGKGDNPEDRGDNYRAANNLGSGKEAGTSQNCPRNVERWLQSLDTTDTDISEEFSEKLSTEDATTTCSKLDHLTNSPRVPHTESSADSQPQNEVDKTTENKANDSEEDPCDVLEDLSTLNRSYRPFRTEESMGHTMSHTLHSDVTSVASSTIAPEVIRSKVRNQKKKEKQKQFARRIRKSGEASISTKARRENLREIKQSSDGIWS